MFVRRRCDVCEPLHLARGGSGRQATPKGDVGKFYVMASEEPTGTPIEVWVFWGKEHKRSSAVVVGTPRCDAVGRNVAVRYVSTTVLCPQLTEQCLGFLEVGCIQALGEPPVDRGQELASLSALALLLPQAAQAHGGPQFE